MPGGDLEDVDTAAGCLDLRACRTREGVGNHEERDCQLAGAQDLEWLVEGSNQPRGAQDVLVDRDGTGLEATLGRRFDLEGARFRERADGPDVHDLVLDPEAVLEAPQLGDALVQRRLAAFEPGRDGAAGAGLLALRATACRLALAGGDAAADPDAVLARPYGGLKVVEFHAFSPVSVSAISSTVTRNRT